MTRNCHWPDGHRQPLCGGNLRVNSVLPRSYGAGNHRRRRRRTPFSRGVQRRGLTSRSVGRHVVAKVVGGVARARVGMADAAETGFVRAISIRCSPGRSGLTFSQVGANRAEPLVRCQDLVLVVGEVAHQDMAESEAAQVGEGLAGLGDSPDHE